MKRRPILIATLIAIGLVLGYLLLYPVNIDPEAWTPPEAPELTGVYEVNSRLSSLERLAEGIAVAPEDVAVDSQGRIYGGLADGRILRLQADGSQPESFVNTGGRPLGLRFDASGNLIVCDAHKGLLSVAPDGSITALSTEADGVPFKFANDLDIAADGTIYFTDASSKFSIEEFIAEYMEHRPNGRLLAYDPNTKQTRVVLDQLYFANGVAVSPDQSFVLVVESSTYSVRRYWLSGARRGQSDTFIENLPGIPDGLSSNGKDIFWLTLATPRDKSLDAGLPQPFIRKVIWRLPTFLRPAPQRYAFVFGLSADGRVIHNLQDSSANAYAFIANAVEHEGMLYLGSSAENAIGRLAAPPRKSLP